jgi:CBS domain-containing protein
MVKVKEIMRKFVITVDPGFTLDAIAKILNNNRIGCVIVMEGQKPIGIVTSEDVVGAVANGTDPKKYKAKQLLKRKFITASPGDDLLKITKKMVRTGIKRIPIIEKGRLEGIVTDKEILVTTPELIDVLSEKLKARVERVARPEKRISGICERCEGYSDHLTNTGGRWYCEGCSEE